MQLADQLRSTSFRMGCAYAALFFFSVMAILGGTYLATTAEMEGFVRSSLKKDVAHFHAAFAASGISGLREAVQEAAEGPSDDRFFLLVDPDGRRLEGDLPAALWLEGSLDRHLGGDVVRQDPALLKAAAAHPDSEIRFLALGSTIEGFRVMAARDAHTLDETQEVILSALVWGSLPTTMLALAGGFAVSIGPTRRVDRIAATTREIAAGRFDVRLHVSGRKDELDRLSADINGMLDRISILMSSLKQVSTDIAHDLRTPLARLRQRLETAHGEAVEAAERGPMLETAIAEVDSIIETFNALLRIAQIEAGARKAKFVRLDLSTVLAQIHEIFESVAEETGHRLTTEIEPGLWIDGDRDLLQQLFANLVENALTHAPAPGRIRIAAARAGDAVVACVADDGPGVPAEERTTIFRRLYRLDRSRTTPGNGLGLALVAAISDLHGAKAAASDNRPALKIEMRFEGRDGDHAPRNSNARTDPAPQSVPPRDPPGWDITKPYPCRDEDVRPGL